MLDLHKLTRALGTAALVTASSTLVLAAGGAQTAGPGQRSRAPKRPDRFRVEKHYPANTALGDFQRQVADHLARVLSRVDKRTIRATRPNRDKSPKEVRRVEGITAGELQSQVSRYYTTKFYPRYGFEGPTLAQHDTARAETDSAMRTIYGPWGLEHGDIRPGTDPGAIVATRVMSSWKKAPERLIDPRHAPAARILARAGKDTAYAALLAKVLRDPAALAKLFAESYAADRPYDFAFRGNAHEVKASLGYRLFSDLAALSTKRGESLEMQAFFDQHHIHTSLDARLIKIAAAEAAMLEQSNGD